jgi:GNAT superfamily N-acetyltransferase
MTVLCRPAGPADVEGICAVRIRSWQEAYRGIVPQDFLDELSVEAEVDRFHARSERPGFLRGQHVAEDGGTVVGWSAIGEYRAEGEPPPPGPRCGSVNAIYVLPSHWGGGIGRALMAYSLDLLAADGLSPVLLWVLRDNAQARRFYDAYGFRPDGATHTYEVGGETLPEVRYAIVPGAADRPPAP